MARKKTRNQPEKWVTGLFIIGVTAYLLGRHFNSFAIGWAYFIAMSYVWEIWAALQDLNDEESSEKL